ncbi:MAG: hypothetical protein GTN93_19885, partial [Anaerolineae bacterium]|nr:hypothetical protein [Anaerolineae bacterium]NIQ80304.1 hypothetical protein [Anaerolineae bacterium]
MQGNFASISAVRIFEHMRNITAFGPREDGTIAYRQVVGYIEDALSDLGLDVHRQTLSCWVIEPIETSLRVTEPREMDIKCYHGSLTGVTDSAGVQGELAFVNKAFDEDFVGRDLAGKVAIAWQEQYWERGEQPRDKLRRATEHGAIGFIFAMKRRDNLITCWSLSREPAAIPFVSISYPDFLSLRDMMEKG